MYVSMYGMLCLYVTVCMYVLLCTYVGYVMLCVSDRLCYVCYVINICENVWDCMYDMYAGLYACKGKLCMYVCSVCMYVCCACTLCIYACMWVCNVGM